jgi:hypothetical protein
MTVQNQRKERANCSVQELWEREERRRYQLRELSLVFEKNTANMQEAHTESDMIKLYRDCSSHSVGEDEEESLHEIPETGFPKQVVQYSLEGSS